MTIEDVKKWIVSEFKGKEFLFYLTATKELEIESATKSESERNSKIDDLLDSYDDLMTQVVCKANDGNLIEAKDLAESKADEILFIDGSEVSDGSVQKVYQQFKALSVASRGAITRRELFGELFLIGIHVDW